MPFNSPQFAVFLGVTWLAWLIAPRNLRWLVLLVASAYFCGAYFPQFLLVAAGATALAYFTALKMAALPEPSRRRPLLTAAVMLLVANLALFKYAGEFGLSLALPVGVSFYTFQLIGYLVDVQRGTQAERDPRTFSLFVLLFPKMVSGPIERSRTLLPQLRSPTGFDYVDTVAGLRLVIWGLFKKLVIADRLAPFVSHVYDSPEAATGPLTAVASVMYAFQLYCDFSGYTDIAIGTARVFGYRLSPNFNRPYIATSIQDFWKRWHISLTSWLTDYVYTPLTRQKTFRIKLYYTMLASLFVTFVVSGIWHGSHWNFVVWGALHGAYIVLSLMTQKQRAAISQRVGLSNHPRVRNAWRIAATFTLVCVAYVLFRAGSLADAGTLYASFLVGWSDAFLAVKDLVRLDQGSFMIGAIATVILLVGEMCMASKPAQALFASHAPLRRSLYFLGALAVVALAPQQSGQDFIYFRF